MQNILVVKLSAIGDVIHALPVSYAIKETFPHAHLTWVTEPPARPLLELNPCIDELITFHKKEFKSLRGFARNFLPFRRVIRSRRYDAVLDLQGLFKSAAIARLAKAPLKLGTCNMREGSDRVSRPVRGPHAEGHIVERYLDVARALGCRVKEVKFPLEIPEEVQESCKELIREAGADPSLPYAVLAPGAGWPNKRWTPEHFARLANWLYDRQIIPLLVGGGVVDMRLAAEIGEEMGVPPVSLIDKTTLPELAALLAGARLVVGGDTGPVHLAAGLKRPTIMLMGPTDANRNGPYGQQENAIEAEHPCKYCWKRACPYGRDCLLAIRPEAVEEKAERLLELG